MADEQFLLTPGGYQRLQDELTALQAQAADRRGLLGDIDDDRNNQDGLETGAFFETKTMLEHVEERIGHIQYVLDRAVVRDDDPNPALVDPGERVTVWNFQERVEEVWDILSSPEVHFSYAREDGGRDVSIESPVGRAILGCGVGDIVEVEAPDGVVRYAVRRIAPIPGS